MLDICGWMGQFSSSPTVATWLSSLLAEPLSSLEVHSYKSLFPNWCFLFCMFIFLPFVAWFSVSTFSYGHLDTISSTFSH